MFWQLLFTFTFLKSIICIKLYLAVEENEKPNTAIGNLIKLIQNRTNSTDQIVFKNLNLDMQKSNFGSRHFIYIDPKTTDIWIHTPIDREEICQEITKCEKGAFLDYIVYTDIQLYELQIEVIDKNDNYPTFQPDEKTLKIPEGIAKYTEYSLPVAKDKDSGKFGITKYTLQAISTSMYEKYFKLRINANNHNPYLSVIDELDRELVRNFEFYLFAIDGGGNKGKCKITVEITDINDNTPQWIGLPYRKEIAECTTDNKIMQLVAQDKDDPLTDGGQIRYKISENSPNVEVMMRTFFITENILYLNNGALKSLGQNKVSIVVIATDGGGRNNETTIELDIKDCNDHSPMIKIHNPNLQVHENEMSKKTITMITVTDEDLGINSDFSCNLNDTNFVNLELFYQSNRSNVSQKIIYKLNTIVDRSFDREKMSRHTLEIVCTDSGQPSLSSVEKITIFVIDKNDNPPIFETKYKAFSISEDLKIGSEIGKIVATDLDIDPNNKISYSIVDKEDAKQTFSINEFGEIQLSKALDRETKERYEFDVLASDSRIPDLNDTCRIRIMVMDVNDNAPEISEKHYFKIIESWGTEHKHVFIGKLNATDRDNGVNGTFIFKIRLINPTFSHIQVFNDGRLSIFGVIDREKIELIEVQIDVIDNGSPVQVSTTTIYIEIIDLNDNKPIFTIPNSHVNNYINITSENQPGFSVTKVIAIDPDKDMNGSVVYSITGTDSSKKYFSIQSDGQIILNEKILEKIRPDRLTIEASDQGNPPMKTSTNLYIRYPMKINDRFDKGNTDVMDSKYTQNNNQKKTSNFNSLSNNTVMVAFLIIIIGIILIGVTSVFLFLYCRCQGIHRMGDNGKHVPNNRDSSVVYQKACSKNPGNKSDSLLNSESIMRNDNYNQMTIPNYPPNYTNLMILKNNCCSPIDNSYQFGQTLLTDNYSAFHPKSITPTPDKDHQEFVAFNPEECWNQPPQKQMTNSQMRKKNLSESSNDVYESDVHSRYAFLHGTNVNNFDASQDLTHPTHFTTPNQSRRSDLIHSRPETNQRVKVNLVNSSFV